MEGTCLCKAVTVKVNDDNLFGEQRRGHLCHCLNCKKVAGSLFGANLIIEEEKVKITGEGTTVSNTKTILTSADNLNCYSDPETMSGTPVNRYFCKTCGVPIRSISSLYPGKVVLKLGIFTHGKIPTPEWESFSSQIQGFETRLAGAKQYKTKTGGEVMD